MPPKSNVPIRVGGSRARSGCRTVTDLREAIVTRTCKQRHVKCDEVHPICAKCQRGNLQCIYDPVQPLLRCNQSHNSRSIDPLILGTAEYLNDSAWPSLNRSINPYASFRTVEISAIQHFAHALGRELAGSFSNTIWCDILPRVAQHEPSVWHGIVAVSILDMDLRQNYEGFRHTTNSAAIMHYSKAMQELHIRLEELDESLCKDVVLLCCILFAVFECLQSQFNSALRHISGGMKLLMEWDGSGQVCDQVSLGNYLNRTTLQSIFLFLDSQAIQLGAAGFHGFFSGPALDDQLQITQSPTVEEAHLLLTQTFHRLSHWENWSQPVTACGNRPDDEHMVLEKLTIQSQLDQWNTVFLPILIPNETDPASLLLLVHRRVLQIFFNKSADGESEVE